LSNFKEYFVNNDTSGYCLVRSYKLIKQSDSSEYSGQIVELDDLSGEINIFPSKSLDTENDETLSLYLQAETKGGKQEEISISIEMLSTKTNKDVINQAPNFENAPTELILRFNDKETEILPDIID
jgi:hypothetical protein